MQSVARSHAGIVVKLNLASAKATDNTPAFSRGKGVKFLVPRLIAGSQAPPDG